MSSYPQIWQAFNENLCPSIQLTNKSCSSRTNGGGRPRPTCLGEVFQAWQHHSSQVPFSSWLIALLNLSVLGFSFVVFHDKAKIIQQGNLPLSSQSFFLGGLRFCIINSLEFAKNIEQAARLVRWTISSLVDRGICQKPFHWRKGAWREWKMQNLKQYCDDATSLTNPENAKKHSSMRFGMSF